ncbi:hypothetical protein FIBSPDRAFT_1035367 [Athelia psychrophila]|uniref:Uncharacterized protein n=1 Tax=Athelia psychrophila TaxID=1759441 RepID=A0A166X0B2_9AGAM|nr:hypothetical protein FIBSPDRAFT_1035367 [Fibularhizoctonia sp. CBS 109695]
MSALADHIDRFSQTVKSLKTTVTALSEPSPAPFTRAVLSTPLGDLIRDVDHSELGLFTLVEAPHEKARVHEEIARVEFHGATPLRRPAAARRDDAMRIKELEPEVYANAALKYLDRYQSIKPMPRARTQVVDILEQLASVRANISSLNDVLAEKQSTNIVPLSPKSQANAEEKRIQELQKKIAQLKKRKEALTKSKTRLKPTTRPLVSPSTPSFQSEPSSSEISPSTSTSTKGQDSLQDAEAAFWQSSSSPALMKFTDTMITDEIPDLGDVSIGGSSMTFDSPLKSKDQDQDQEENSFFLNDGDEEDYTEVIPQGVVGASADENWLEDEEAVDEDGDEGDEDQTLRLPKPPSPVSEPTPEPPPPPAAQPPTPARQSKVKINSEMERIAAKIWATVGEIIMPGNHFDTSGSGPASSKPPRAKDTLAHLRSIAAQTPSSASPSSASVSSISLSAANTSPSSGSGQPSTQQIITAHFLLTLLDAPPQFAMPLIALKGVLASKVGSAGGPGGQATTRTIYGCVAKKLVKIERGSGEQVVKFDA